MDGWNEAKTTTTICFRSPFRCVCMPSLVRLLVSSTLSSLSRFPPSSCLPYSILLCAIAFDDLAFCPARTLLLACNSHAHTDTHTRPYPPPAAAACTVLYKSLRLSFSANNVFRSFTNSWHSHFRNSMGNRISRDCRERNALVKEGEEKRNTQTRVDGRVFFVC